MQRLWDGGSNRGTAAVQGTNVMFYALPTPSHSRGHYQYLVGTMTLVGYVYSQRSALIAQLELFISPAATEEANQESMSRS
jgi:hypothetical protein